MKIKYIILIVFSLLIGGCTTVKEKNSAHTVQENSVYILNPMIYDNLMTVPFNTTIKLLTDTENIQMQESFQTAFEIFAKQFDRYQSWKHEDITNVYDINQSYGSQAALSISRDLFELLKLGKELSVLSEGKFNITIGALYDLWADKFSPFPQENTDPSDAQIQTAKSCIVPYQDIDSVLELNEENQTVVLHQYPSCKDRVILDVGAIAKGYTIERVQSILQQYETPFIINAGTSSIAAYSPAGIDKDWYVGVRDPFGRVYSLYDYHLENSGMFTTSGDDSNYFLKKTDDGDIIRHHILDCQTGFPNNYIRSATVYTQSHAAVSDALTTALFNCRNTDERIHLIKKFEEYYHINIAWSCFEQISDKGGKLYSSDDFRQNIMPDSYSKHILETEDV